MATIQPYVAKGTQVNQKIELKAKKVVWITAGRGIVSAISDYVVAVDGKISILGYNGDLNIHLRLTDENASATSGPCVLQLNTLTDENATYKVGHDTLTVYAVLGGEKQNISILRCNKDEQTECKLFGHVNETVHLDPVT
ncbi:MAG: hypothetical protein KDE48_13240 [Anaerolineales bacterium]|nr:hypothetical protein [Anaerolineales bacterium]